MLVRDIGVMPDAAETLFCPKTGLKISQEVAVEIDAEPSHEGMQSPELSQRKVTSKVAEKLVFCGVRHQRHLLSKDYHILNKNQ